MNAKSALTQAPVTTFTAAVVAGVISIGLLSAVTGLFQHDGKPLQALVVAERACTAHAFVSERQACMRSYAAATRANYIASR